MRLLVLTLVLSFAFAGALGQLPDSAGAWRSVKPESRVSPEWRKQRQVLEVEAERLRRKTRAVQIEELKKVAKTCQVNSPSATAAYRCAYLLLEFPTAFEQLGAVSTTVAAAGNTRGSPDPEFMRICYIAMCLWRSPEKWPGLGKALMERFPGDQRLRDAYVLDCAYGNLTYDEIQVGLRIVDEKAKAGLSKLEVLRRKASLTKNLYFLKRLDQDRNEAIVLYEELMRIEENAKNLEIYKAWLKVLKRK